MNDLAPELRDRVAAEFALGTLGGAARRRFERLQGEQAEVRDAARSWELRLNRLARAAPAVEPPERVWEQVLGRIRPSAAPVRASRLDRLWRSLGFWRGAAALATAAAAALAVHVALDERQAGQGRLDGMPQASSHVAVLLDRSRRPMMNAELDVAGGRLVLRLNIKPPRDFTEKTLEVWLVPPAGAPRSLGLLPSEERGTTTTFTLSEDLAELLARAALAVSLEPAGGSRANAPSGPVLFSGALVPVDL